MSMNRDAAINYAKRYWDTVCDDDVIWTSNEAINIQQKRKKLGAPVSDGWEVRFVPDGAGAEEAVFRRTNRGVFETKLIQEWAGLADCAHFLSKCLHAGGINVSEISVPKLIATLQARQDTKTLGEKVSQEHGQAIVNSELFKVGDMIGYFNIDPHGDYNGARQYSHSAMYAGKLPATGDAGHITCHTKSRFPGLSHYNDKWFLDGGKSYEYTFIHFSSDDQTPDANMVDSLAGWWKVRYGARTSYYYISRNGGARYTLTAPTTNHEIRAPADSAYWFQNHNEITFTWRKSGALERWTQGRASNEFSLVGDNNASGTATKMF
jgi:hypothetical protein